MFQLFKEKKMKRKEKKMWISWLLYGLFGGGIGSSMVPGLGFAMMNMNDGDMDMCDDFFRYVLVAV